uniref:Mediator of DNA damage checkpoint protein 1 n=1 Tax=Scleropages formosus TaxID=113540 RepID=A0A8C9SL87_SCLFO
PKRGTSELEPNPATQGARLERKEGPPRTGQLPLYLGNNVLGRDPTSCSLVLSASSVSKCHAVISLSVFPGDKFCSGPFTEALLWDLGSLNGTRKGRFRLTPNVRYALSEGEYVVLADVPCQYVLVGEVTPSGEKDEKGRSDGEKNTSAQDGTQEEQRRSEATTPNPARTTALALEQTPAQPQKLIELASESDTDDDGKGRRDDRRQESLIHTMEKKANENDTHMEENAVNGHQCGNIKVEGGSETNDCGTSLTANVPALAHDAGPAVEGKGEKEKNTSQHEPVQDGHCKSTGDMPAFHMDSDTDIEGEQEVGDVSGTLRNAAATSVTPSTPTDLIIRLDSDTDVEDNEGSFPTPAHVLDSSAKGVSAPQVIAAVLHLDSNTDSEGVTECPTKSEPVAHNKSTPSGALLLKPQELDLGSDTDAEDVDAVTLGPRSGDTDVEDEEDQAVQGVQEANVTPKILRVQNCSTPLSSEATQAYGGLPLLVLNSPGRVDRGQPEGGMELGFHSGDPQQVKDEEGGEETQAIHFHADSHLSTADTQPVSAFETRDRGLQFEEEEAQEGVTEPPPQNLRGEVRENEEDVQPSRSRRGRRGEEEEGQGKRIQPAKRVTRRSSRAETKQEHPRRGKESEEGTRSNKEEDEAFQDQCNVTEKRKRRRNTINLLQEKENNDSGAESVEGMEREEKKRLDSERKEKEEKDRLQKVERENETMEREEQTEEQERESLETEKKDQEVLERQEGEENKQLKGEEKERGQKEGNEREEKELLEEAKKEERGIDKEAKVGQGKEKLEKETKEDKRLQHENKQEKNQKLEKEKNKEGSEKHKEKEAKQETDRMLESEKQKRKDEGASEETVKRESEKELKASTRGRRKSRAAASSTTAVKETTGSGKDMVAIELEPKTDRTSSIASASSTICNFSTGMQKRGRAKKSQGRSELDPDKVDVSADRAQGGRGSRSQTVTDSEPMRSETEMMVVQDGKAAQHSKASTSKGVNRDHKGCDPVTAAAVDPASTPVLVKRSRGGNKSEKLSDLESAVLFTGLTDDQGETTVLRLGGSMAKGVSDMTHLVTDKVRRTVKFLCAVARGIPVVTTAWLEKCGKSAAFLSPSAFLVKDVEQEKKFNFCLEESLRVARAQPLLQGYEIHVTRSVKPEPSQMKDIISCSGARYLPKMPTVQKLKTVVISCEEDASLCGPALSASLPVLSAEFLLSGILQQKVDLVTHALTGPCFEAKSAPRGRNRK